MVPAAIDVAFLEGGLPGREWSVSPTPLPPSAPTAQPIPASGGHPCSRPRPPPANSLCFLKNSTACLPLPGRIVRPRRPFPPCFCCCSRRAYRTAPQPPSLPPISAPIVEPFARRPVLHRSGSVLAATQQHAASVLPECVVSYSSQLHAAPATVANEQRPAPSLQQTREPPTSSPQHHPLNRGKQSQRQVHHQTSFASSAGVRALRGVLAPSRLALPCPARPALPCPPPNPNSGLLLSGQSPRSASQPPAAHKDCRPSSALSPPLIPRCYDLLRFFTTPYDSLHSRERPSVQRISSSSSLFGLPRPCWKRASQ
ncbi:hypothetical protein BDY17DRAFT_4804 [Neohortaea acidophila]|uniref:Uncharacterized protein n=1 Tax=Neohortaea acidophila TaxID=245834 RepID=A0A6A6Q6Y5_9PEZI|nr:uncharacterized protein BDY17DRAFT_4804 [Neohortaea acidophila]KAF2487167.1 hypothetical protein BDY17DRAFT_4804 [Neohortaea acidophila]